MIGPTARAFGTPMPFTYGGKEVLVFGRIQEVYPKLETEYLRRHPDPMELYRQKVDAGLFADEEERKQFLQFCVDKACEVQDKLPADVLNWFGTRAGTIYYGTLTVKWPPKDGETAKDAPYLTEKEMADLFAEEIAAHIRAQIEKADSMERLSVEAENAAIMALHQAVNMASGTDLAGKGIGPTSTEGAKGTARPG